MIPVRLIDIKKAQTLLGFAPKTDIYEGIAKTISWYKKMVSSESASRKVQV